MSITAAALEQEKAQGPQGEAEALEREEKERKKLAALNPLMQEVISTEKTYVQNLEHILKHVIQPLATIENKVVKDMLALLTPISTLLATHTHFLAALSEAVSTNNNVEENFHAFTRVLKVYAPSFGQAAGYIISNPQLSKLVETFLAMSEKNKDIKSVCQTLEKTGLTLGALLIVPVQRVPRYKLFAEQMIKFNVFSSLDAELADILKVIAAIALKFNEDIRLYENCEKIAALRTKLVPVVVSNKLVDVISGIVNVGRRVVGVAPANPDVHEHLSIIFDKKADAGEEIKSISDIIENLNSYGDIDDLQLQINEMLVKLTLAEQVDNVEILSKEDCCSFTVTLANKKKYSYTLKTIGQRFELEIDVQEGMQNFSEQELCCIWAMRDEIAKHVAAPLGWVKTSRGIDYSAALIGKIKSELSNDETKVNAERIEEQKKRVEAVRTEAAAAEEAAAAVQPVIISLRPQEEEKEDAEEEQKRLQRMEIRERQEREAAAAEAALFDRILSTLTAPPLRPEVVAQPVVVHVQELDVPAVILHPLTRIAPPPPRVWIADNVPVEPMVIVPAVQVLPASDEQNRAEVPNNINVMSEEMNHQENRLGVLGTPVTPTRTPPPPPPVPQDNKEEAEFEITVPVVVQMIAAPTNAALVVNRYDSAIQQTPVIMNTVVPTVTRPILPMYVEEERIRFERVVIRAPVEHRSVITEVPQPVVVYTPAAQSLVRARRVVPPPPPQGQEVAAVSPVQQVLNAAENLAANVARSGRAGALEQYRQIIVDGVSIDCVFRAVFQPSALQPERNDMSVLRTSQMIRPLVPPMTRVAPPPPLALRSVGALTFVPEAPAVPSVVSVPPQVQPPAVITEVQQTVRVQRLVAQRGVITEMSQQPQQAIQAPPVPALARTQRTAAAVRAQSALLRQALPQVPLGMLGAAVQAMLIPQPVVSAAPQPTPTPQSLPTPQPTPAFTPQQQAAAQIAQQQQAAAQQAIVAQQQAAAELAAQQAAAVQAQAQAQALNAAVEQFKRRGR